MSTSLDAKFQAELAELKAKRNQSLRTLLSLPNVPPGLSVMLSTGNLNYAEVDPEDISVLADLIVAFSQDNVAEVFKEIEKDKEKEKKEDPKPQQKKEDPKPQQNTTEEPIKTQESVEIVMSPSCESSLDADLQISHRGSNFSNSSDAKDEDKSTHKLKVASPSIDEKEEEKLFSVEEIASTEPPAEQKIVSSPVTQLTRRSPPKKLLPVVPQDSAETDKVDIIFKTCEDARGVSFQTIKAATLERLIERLAYNTQPDRFYTQDFMMTYRSFIEPKTLLTKLFERYSSPESTDIIKVRTCNVFRTWLSIFPTDFVVRKTPNEDENKEAFEKEQIQKKEFRESFSKFLENTLKNDKNKLYDSLKRQFESANSLAQKPQFETTPPPLRPSKGDIFLEWDVIEVARQITIIESTMYNSIKPIECIGLAWQKPTKEILSPNIWKMTQHFNNISQWVVKNILAQQDLKVRIKVLNKFIKLADKLKKLNNINGLMEILSGLQNAAVFRLKKTWEKCDTSVYEPLANLLSSKSNHSEYRSNLHEHIEPPVVPYLGIYLSDLTFVEEGNKDFLPSPLDSKLQLINFEKRRKYSRIIQDMKLYQQPYNLDVDENLKSKLMEQLGRPHLSDADLFNISLELEPREGSPAPTQTSELLANLKSQFAPAPTLNNNNNNRSFTTTFKALTFGKSKMRNTESALFNQMEAAAKQKPTDGSSHELIDLPEVDASQKIKQLTEKFENVSKFVTADTVFIADYRVIGFPNESANKLGSRKSYLVRIVTDNIIFLTNENGKLTCPFVFNAEFTRFIVVGDSVDIKFCVELETSKQKLFVCLKDDDEKSRFSKDVKKVINDYKRKKILALKK